MEEQDRRCSGPREGPAAGVVDSGRDQVDRLCEPRSRAHPDRAALGRVLSDRGRPAQEAHPRVSRGPPRSASREGDPPRAPRLRQPRVRREGRAGPPSKRAHPVPRARRVARRQRRQRRRDDQAGGARGRHAEASSPGDAHVPKAPDASRRRRSHVDAATASRARRQGVRRAGASRERTPDEKRQADTLSEVSRGGPAAARYEVVFDVLLYMVDSGAIFHTGTTRLAASVVQDGVDCGDEKLCEAIEQALVDRARSRAHPRRHGSARPSRT